MGELVLLRDIPHCVLCFQGDTLTHDHMVPVMASKQHRGLLGDFITDAMNLSPICRREHDQVDKHKLRAYKLNGVAGLVDYLASGYPYSSSEDIAVVQRRHRAYILNLLVRRRSMLNGHVRQDRIDDYDRASDQAQLHLTKILRQGIE